MFKNLLVTIVVSLLLTTPAAVAQIIKAESPTHTNVNVQADPQGHLYTTPVPGGPAAPVMIIQDPTTATSRANVMRPGNIPIPPAGVYALDTMGFEYCFDGVNWEALTCTGNHGIEVNLNWQSLTAVKISKDANANIVSNPIWCEITNGTAANAQATPIYAAVSKDTSINSVTNPIWLELTNGTTANSQAAPLFSAVSKDTSINSVTNPIWLELTNGTTANSQAAPLFSAVSKDTSINSVTNPIWLELTNGTAANAQSTPVYAAVSKDTSANAQGNPIYAAVSKDTSANAQGNPLYAAISKDTSANAQGNPIYSAISKDTSANGLTNPIYCQLSDGTNAFMTTTSYPGYSRMQDGDSAILADVLDAFADGMATTINGLATASVQMRYNGATLDMARSGPNKEDLTYINNWPNAFDAANARANVYKVGSKEYNPPMEGPTAVNAVAALILTAKQIINWPNACVWLKNVGGGGAGAFSDADIQVSPDGTNYVSLMWTTCDGLTSGNTCVYCFTAHAYNWVRVYVTGFAAASDTTADAWLTSNAN